MGCLGEKKAPKGCELGEGARLSPLPVVATLRPVSSSFSEEGFLLHYL